MIIVHITIIIITFTIVMLLFKLIIFIYLLLIVINICLLTFYPKDATTWAPVGDAVQYKDAKLLLLLSFYFQD